MKFFCNLAIVLAVSSALHAMHPLKSIEKALVLREIEMRGLSAIEKAIEIAQSGTSRSRSEPIIAQPPRPSVVRSSSSHNISRITVPTFLKIEATFCKPENTADALAIAIFNTITSIEHQDGYHPTAIETIDGHHCYTMQPTNYLGNYTRYYWEENNKDIVYVKADITNKKDLLEIINNQKKTLHKAISINQ